MYKLIKNKKRVFYQEKLKEMFVSQRAMESP